MDVWFSQTRRVAAIRPAGPVGPDEADRLRLALLRATPALLTVVDLAEVTVLDSTAVAVLVAGAMRAKACRRQVLVANAHGRPLQVITMIGATDLLAGPLELPFTDVLDPSVDAELTP